MSLAPLASGTTRTTHERARAPSRLSLAAEGHREGRDVFICSHERPDRCRRICRVAPLCRSSTFFLTSSGETPTAKEQSPRPSLPTSTGTVLAARSAPDRRVRLLERFRVARSVSACSRTRPRTRTPHGSRSQRRGRSPLSTWPEDARGRVDTEPFELSAGNR